MEPVGPPLAPGGLLLIETFGRRDGSFVRLAAHLARLESSARTLGFAFDRAAVLDALAGVPETGDLRVRLTLDAQGSLAVQTAALVPSPPVWTVAIHAARLDPDDPWLRIKSSARSRYDAARSSLPAGLEEWLFLNTRGEVCEGTITNLFLRRGGKLLTPPLACGLLPGVLRAAILENGAEETILTPSDLRQGELLVGNSLRGLAPALLVD